ncbi:hypothetical protein AURDEDRAFT_151858 [Auricularia subglabra TFB-10046 SS5]|nr:hypothetical protein AURDEDRAFT_151858 [Auricularia subglabra TFB-10046 SS5]
MVRERDVSMYDDGHASVPETIVVDSSGSSPEPAPKAKRASRRVVEVDMPTLSSSDKEAYQDLNTPKSVLDEPGDDSAPVPTKILAEQRLKSDLHYYVLHNDNVIRKYPGGDMKKDHKDLVNAYETAKDDDTLEPFDFDDKRIESKSRVLRIRIQRPAKTDTPVKTKPEGKDVAPGAKGKREYRATDDESSDSPSAEEVDSDYEQQESPERPQRRSTRRAATFGPKSKTVVASPVKKTRASARERKTVSYGKMMEQSDSDIEMIEDEEAPAPKEKRTTHPKKRVLSRPAYGNIRHVSELSDAEDDDRDRLHAHRMHCEKCSERAAHIQLAEHRRKKRRKGRGRGKNKAPNSSDEDEDLTDGEADFEVLGGWVRCLKCCVVAHWKCLGTVQRDEVLRAIREKDTAQADGLPRERRKKVDLFETTEFVCGACSKGGICMACKEVAVEKFEQQLATSKAPKPDGSGDVEMADATADSDKPPAPEPEPTPLLFRCVTCKRAAHYAHLTVEDATDVQDVAVYYQDEQNWQCDDCVSFTLPLDCILAWRPYPEDAVEALVPQGTMIDIKQMLPREYLVKWQERSYKRVSWVPHGWLVATAPAKLKNFVNGTKASPLPLPKGSAAPSKRPTPGPEDEDDFRIGKASPPPEEIGQRVYGPPPACQDAESLIPALWKTVDRVLDVKLWCPPGCGKSGGGGKPSKRQSGQRVVEDDDEDESEDDDAEDSRLADALATARLEGEEPDAKMLKSIPEWEKRHGCELTEDDIGLVVWGYFKWVNLTYDQCTWEAPPEEGDETYPAFKRAFQRLLASRKVEVKLKGTASKGNKFREIKGQPNICNDTKLALHDFQLDGLNWLYFNWFKGRSSILADEMGLTDNACFKGKTVQMTTLIGYLVKTHQAMPFLVVVPNSTLSNWMREFERWAPEVVVVPFFGDARSRDLVKEYEMYHEYPPKGCSPIRFHVLLSSYESITSNTAFTTFKQVKMWEGIVVDEGQRLKSDSSMLFRRLTELNTPHRILMTGTPLNNNIRELFNLMNFLDPAEWSDLAGLEERYKVLTEELVSELHEKLKPYFLRRTKTDVLTLPPKNELIVPVTMTQLQKTVYKSVIGRNAEVLQSLLRGGKGGKLAGKQLMNVLMHLRKCIQHPYLVDPELEPRDVTPREMHKNLVDASAKLQLLKTMLPKLKERGHRVLIFTQFVIVLNIIEDFLVAEGHTFRRLDGSTSQPERQKCMDDFNAAESDIFVFMLSTRAGGVGINLYSADTVIVLDPDHNPHNDLQAIARAHRFGQTKPVLVFKLMMKDSAEVEVSAEKIMQAGKKKLALDHLIVQTMDDEDGTGEDVQSLLTFGAKALFDEESTAQTITYSAHDVEQLIIRTETAVDVEEEVKKGGLSFEFAKIWLPTKGAVEDVPDEPVEADEVDRDFWAETLAKATAEQEAAKEAARQQLGRGARRRKEVNYVDISPEKVDRKGKGRRSVATTDDDDAFDEPNAGRSDSDSEVVSTYGDADDLGSEQAPPRIRGLAAPSEAAGSLPLVAPGSYMGIVDIPVAPKKRSKKRKLADQENQAEGLESCGLCHQQHGPKSCFMVENSANLLEYRKLLFDNSNDEPYETRATAVRVIDRHLNQRGLSHLLRGLPAMPPPPEPLPAEHKVKKRKTDASGATTTNGIPKPAVLADAIVNTTVSPPLPQSAMPAPPKPTAAKAPPPSGPYTTAPLPTSIHPRPAESEPVARISKVSAAASTGGSSRPVATNPAVQSPAQQGSQQEPARPRPSLGSSPSMSSSKPAAQPATNAAVPGMRQTTLKFGRKDSKGDVEQCPVCECSPSHPVVRCPTVQQGVDQIRSAIGRLKGMPGMDTTLTTLRQVLAERTAIHSPSASSPQSAPPKPPAPPNPPHVPTNPSVRRKSNPKPLPIEDDVIVISD